ncbi:MAG: prepilin-type N-terminal cleavage/methylation domain-containing protein [Niameybacter sp.]
MMNRQASKDEKGMTLIEVVLALVLSSLFFCSILDLTGQGMAWHVNLQEEAKLRREMNRVRLFVEDRWDEARKVEIKLGKEVDEHQKSLNQMTFDYSNLDILPYEQEGEQLYKMKYGSNVVKEGIQSITLSQKGKWIFITCTLKGRGACSLTVYILLDSTYKKCKYK